MAFEHGVKVSQVETSIATPVTAASGVPFAVGTAPVHMVGGAVNTPVLCNSYAEAVQLLGYSDNWEKWSLCEVMYSHFRLFASSPVIFVNVYDPAVYKASIADNDYDVVDYKITLPLDVIASSIVLTSSDGATTYTAGTDYGTFYDKEQCIIEIIKSGSIPAGTTSLKASFDVDNPTWDVDDIIGGYNVNTHKSSGFELLDSVFPKYAIVPDLLIAPGYSHDPELAAIMAAKASNINGRFEAKALIDVDTDTVTYYSDVNEWKNQQNITSKYQILFFPMVKLGDRKFHLSTQAAGLMAQVDNDNGGCPAESPSNKRLQMNGAILHDGTEVLLDITQANYLNSIGVVTTNNFIGGARLWGNYTAAYPANTDVKDYMIPVSRMFGWVGNSLILTYWERTDKKLNRRFVETIVDSVNIWLNGITAEGKLLGGRVAFRSDENPETSLMSGKARFHVFLTPPSPAQEIEFLLEYDVSYLSVLFG